MPRGAGAAGATARAAYLQSVLAFLRAQRLPVLAARTRLARAAGTAVLQIGFAAPAPLGLLQMHLSYWK